MAEFSPNEIRNSPLDNNAKEQSGPNLVQEFDVGKLIFTFKKSIPYMLLILAICGTLTYLYIRWSKEIYRASATIQLEFKSSSNLAGLDLAQGFDEGIDAVNLAVERELIKSKLIYQRVVDSLNLGISCYAKGDILSNERYPGKPFEILFSSIPSEFYDKEIHIEFANLNANQFILSIEKETIGEFTLGEKIPVRGFEFRIVKGNGFKPGSDSNDDFFVVVHSDGSLYNYFNKNLNVIAQNANKLSIQFDDSNRQKAIDIVRETTEMYETVSIENKNRVFEQTISYLEQDISKNRDSLEKYERDLFEYNRANLLTPKQRDFQSAFARLKSLESQRKDSEQLLSNYDRIVDAVLSDSSVTYLEVIASLAENVRLDQVISEISSLRNDIDRISAAYKPTTSALKQREDALEKNKLELFTLISYEQSILRKQINALNQQIVDIENNSYEYQSRDPQLSRLERSKSIYSNIVGTLSNKVIEMKISKAGTVPNFRVLSRASASMQPIAPVKTVIYGIGAGVGLALCLALVFVRYIMQNRVNGLKEVSRLTRVPILGIVPKYEKQAMNYSQLVVNINPKSSISEAMRSLRTNLDFLNTSAENTEKVISVTSTISGEGKTFVAINLAGIIAMSGLKVVVLDLDLRKPKVHLGFGVENTEGVSSILVGKSEIEDCMHDSAIEDLKFISAGPLPPNPSELIMSEAFNKLTAKLQEQFDVIVFDTPPVGLVTDGIIAMTKATLPIYVVRANYSRLHFIYNANNLFQSKKFKNLSIVLNSVDFKNTYGYGGYGYGGYGYGGYGYGGYGYGYGSKTGYGYYEEDQKKPSFFSWLLNRKKK